MTRRICVVTGSRAEYGLLRWVMQGIKDDSEFELQIIVTGMHLEGRFGNTWREIEADGFEIDRKVDMSLDSDTAVEIGKSTGKGVIGFAEAFDELRPDIIVILGDRFEMLSAVAAAAIATIPVAHLHGGETTEGAIDEGIRHAITKMSHLHFVAAEEYRNRVIQMGERPDRVFLVGGLGVDGIKRMELLDKEQLSQSLGIDLGNESFLITYHPETIGNDSASSQIAELLAALEDEPDTQLIFTLPNADAENGQIIEQLRLFGVSHSNAHVFTSLGPLRYLSCLKHVNGMIGNSSSGLTEMPSFGKGTINIGDRQKGRLKADSIIDCAAERSSIRNAIAKLRSDEFQHELRGTKNPYGEGCASQKILAVLKSIPFEDLCKKSFFDIDFAHSTVPR